MKLASVKEMRRIDKEAAEQYGIPELLLMENAGRAVFAAAEETCGGVEGRNICLLAGSGNNGGDALVAARYLLQHGAVVRVFILGNTDHYKEAAATNLAICRRLGVSLTELKNEHEWEKLELVLQLSNLIIDGILGTGFSGELREEAKRLIEMVNEAAASVISIDVASGVSADTGAVQDAAVLADKTVTFGLPKPGHFFAPGADCTGELIVDDICLPVNLLTAERLKYNYLDASLAQSLLPVRSKGVHKGSAGRVLVVAGSRGLTGAAALSSTAVLAAGAGISVLATAKSLQELFMLKLTEVMTKGLPEEEDGCLGAEALEPLLELAKDFDTVLLGPGLGRNEKTMELVRSFAVATKAQLVLDADALYAFRGHAAMLAQCQNVPILTPHLGEMAGLLGYSVAELRQDILGRAKDAAADWQSVVVLKSECTVAVLPDGEVYFTSVGNNGMATAGSGDVLAGTVAGLVAEAGGAAPLLGVYLHGRAGDMAAEEKGEGLLAGDILANIGRARAELKNV